ncbi:unnamed protein product [Plutella xylostella]|uniref:(diamondback moth) hypothetical protein n=1 Tax=Plutella xylostella TaxID=51655 RepID=A0A8S4FWM7_PLUXY|nr:unnamed protein product [Plutella xylostella]
MLSVIAMRREDEELGARADADEFVDISQMQLLVEGAGGAGGAALHYGGPPPPLAQPQPYPHPPGSTVDDLFALYFTPTTQHAQFGETLFAAPLQTTVHSIGPRRSWHCRCI